MMLMGYWSCAVQPGTAMTAHGDDEVRRHKGCRTFLLRPRARRPSDPELPPRRSKSTYTLPHPPETARRQISISNIYGVLRCKNARSHRDHKVNPSCLRRRDLGPEKFRRTV